MENNDYNQNCGNPTSNPHSELRENPKSHENQRNQEAQNGYSIDKWGQNVILEELQSKECSEIRRHEILDELRAQKAESATATVNYASALAYCLNRERNWSVRLAQLEELHRLAKKKDAEPKTMLLYIEAVYHRLNAEMDAEQKLNCCETLFKFCKSARRPYEVQKLCTQGILSALSRSNHPAIYRRYRDLLWTLAQTENLEDEIRNSCVQGLGKYLELENDFSFQKRILSRIERLHEKFSTHCVSEIYANGLLKLIRNAPNMAKKKEFLTKLKNHADEMMIQHVVTQRKIQNRELPKSPKNTEDEQIMQEVQHLYAIALIAMIEEEPTVKGRLEYLDTLEVLAERPDSFFQGTYTQGMVEIIKWEEDPEYCLEWLERLKERANTPTATYETRLQYVVGMVWVLKLTENPESGLKLLEQITQETDRETEKSLDLQCLYSSALLLSMQWVNDSAERITQAGKLPNWKSVAPSQFGDLYRSVLQDYISNEWDESVRNVVLTHYR